MPLDNVVISSRQIDYNRNELKITATELRIEEYLAEIHRTASFETKPSCIGPKLIGVIARWIKKPLVWIISENK